MLLWQLHTHPLKHLFAAALERAEKSAITIHDDETEFLIVLQKAVQRLSVERVLTFVGKEVDSAERRRVVHDLLFGLAILHQDDTTENVEPIFWRVLVQLQSYKIVDINSSSLLTLFGSGNGRLDGLTGLARLNVISSCVLLRQHAVDLHYLLFGRDVQTHEGRPITSHNENTPYLS